MLKRFFLQAGGAVAPLFAIAAIPMFAAVGAAVDFSRAYQERTVVQDSLDAAALSGGRKIGTATNDQIKAEVDTFYYNEIGDKIDNPPALVMTVSGGSITLSTTLHVPTFFLRVVGLDEIVFNMMTQAKAGMGTLEVVMVLDNSGSMSGSKISTLKQAANDLTTKLFALQTTSTQVDPVKIGLVPFAASVKVGSQYANASWMDTTAISPYHADTLENYGAPSPVNTFTLFNSLKDSSGNPVTWAGCVQERVIPYDVDDTPASTGNSGTMFVPMFAPDEPDNWTCSTSTCNYIGGSSSSRRYNGARTGSVDQNNYLPDAGDASTCSSQFAQISSVNTSSETITTTSSHGLTSGTQVSFESSNSLPGGLSTNTLYYVISSGLTSTAFKVSTSSGGSAVNLTSSGSGTRHVMRNSNWTCQSGNANCGGSGHGKSETSGFAGQNVSGASMCKYGTPSNKGTVANITVDGYAGGPNFMCTTTAVTPLTTSQSAITSAVNAQQANGYTNIAAGVAWGLRMLSPGAPFTEGRAYTDTNNLKVMIVMTDGANTYQTDSDLFTKSRYSSWGYVVSNHLGTTSTGQVVTKMNERTAQACANAKAQKIQVYTIAFQVTDTDTINMLTTCASDPSMAYQSGNNQALLDAFTAIGDSITSLRVSM